MDFSKFKTSTWLMAGGAIGIIIGGLFLDWVSYDLGEFSYSGADATDINRGLFSLILVVAVGVIAVLSVMGKMPAGKTPLGLISVAASVLATLMMLSILAFEDLGPGSWAIGFWLSLVSTGAATAGAVMDYTAGGGNIKDIIDPNKWKGN